MSSPGGSLRYFVSPITSIQTWKKRTFTVWLDEGSYGESPDSAEIAYLLRMGGIDADEADESFGFPKQVVIPAQLANDIVDAWHSLKCYTNHLTLPSTAHDHRRMGGAIDALQRMTREQTED